MKPNAVKWYSIKAEADDDHAEIRLYQPIGKSFWEERTSAEQFVADLEALDVGNITLRINSPGGDVFDGATIYNALRRHPANITARIEGFCASAASYIMLAADKVVMCQLSWLMIHNASWVAIGNAADMRSTAERLDKLDTSMSRVYQQKTGKDAEWIAAELAREAWYTAEEALEHGFIDEIEEDAEREAEEATAAAVANFDPRAFGIAKFRNTPDRIAALMRQAPAAALRTTGGEQTPAEVPAGTPVVAPDANAAWEIDVARARREREAASC